MSARRHHKSLTARLRERGSVSLEAAVVMPALLALLWMGMQGALMYQGRTTALAAAQEGARVAAGESGTASAGVAAAEDLAGAATLGLKGMQVNGARSATEASVTVRLHIASVVPGWDPWITQSASMPVERITG